MRIAIVMAILLFSGNLFGQLQLFGVIPEAIENNNTFRISHSMGEPFVHKQIISSYSVTEGFQQGETKALVSNIYKENNWSFSFKPNPVTDQLLVEWNDATLSLREVIVYNSSGNMVIRQQITGERSIVLVGHLLPGTYIIRGIDLEGNQIVHQKIIKI